MRKKNQFDSQSGELNLAHSRLTPCQLEEKLCVIKNEKVVILNLVDNELGYAGCKVLVEFLKHCNFIEELLLDINNIGSEEIKLLCEFIGSIQSLQLLSLCANNIGADGIGYLIVAIRKSSIKYLDISANGLGDSGAEIIADMFSTNCLLESIDLGTNNITSNGIVSLANGLKNNRHLKELALDFTFLEYSGMKSLEELLKHNIFLEKLSLRKCNIPANIDIFYELIKNSNLLELDIQGNNISSNHTKNLGDALRSSSIQVLNMDNNQIGNEGAISIAGSMNNLTRLSLYGADIGEKGGKAIIKAAQKSKLVYLNLIANNMKDGCGKRIVELIKDKSELVMYVDDNLFGDDMVATLTECGVIGADC